MDNPYFLPSFLVSFASRPFVLFPLLKTYQILHFPREIFQHTRRVPRDAPQEEWIEPGGIQLVPDDAADGDAFGRAGRRSDPTRERRSDDFCQSRGRARKVEGLKRGNGTEDEDGFGPDGMGGKAWDKRATDT